MAANPYQQSTPNGFAAPAGAFAARMMSPEDLDAFLQAGGTVYEDGSLGFPGALPPAPAGPVDDRYAPLPPPFARDGAFFDRYFTTTGQLPPLANERTPAERMLRQMTRGERTPPPPIDLAVPGGASIQQGKPLAALPPPPPMMPEDQQNPRPAYPQLRGRRTR